jgi:hypothetical protein
MSVTVDELAEGKVIEITLSGKLERADYDRFVPEVNQLVRKHRKINLVFRMIDFHGWSAGALWEDLKFDLKHFNHIHRLAIVGETWWEKGMAQFCRPFTTATVRYFDADRAGEARDWVTEGVTAPQPVG